MKRRTSSKAFKTILILLWFVVFFPQAAHAKVYTEREEIDGSEYTCRPALISKLNSIFDGNASIYQDSQCTLLVDTRIGTKSVPNDGVYKYAGTKGKTNKGTSCWIYANGVYYTLFGELTGSGKAEKNSVKLTIDGTKKMTYANFESWGVRPEPGALIRVDGHSLILLKYDASKIYYLDGNGDGKGLVAVRDYTWSSNPWRNKTISYIIQPKEERYNELYPENPPCEHERRCNETVCVNCEEIYSGENVIHIGPEISMSGIPATHATTGLTDGAACFACGAVLKDQKVIPAVDVAKAYIPENLTVINAYSFAGMDVECVILSEKCERIEAYGFANNASLRFIEIPASVEFIDNTAFEDCASELIIVTSSKSCAHEYAKNKGIQFVLYKSLNTIR